MPKEYNLPTSTTQDEPASITLASHVAGSGGLDRLIYTAKDYARQATAERFAVLAQCRAFHAAAGIPFPMARRATIPQLALAPGLPMRL